MSAPPDARVVLRSRGLLETCDLALQFLVTHAKLYARMALLVALPGLAVSLALHYVARLDWATTWAISVVLAAAFEGPFTVLSGQIALTDGVGVRGALRAFAKRLPVYLFVMAAAGVFQGVAFGMLVVPWFFAALVTVFLPEVVLLEGAGLRSFRRAPRVVFGYNGQALGLVFLLVLVRLAAVVLVDATLRRTLGVLLDVRVRVDTLWDDGGSPYALAGLWLSVPVCAAFRYLAYIDLRTRKEGWDLQRRFHVLSARLAGEGT